MTSSNRTNVQTRPGRCENHGAVEGTRKMPRLLFPFIITGILRLIAMTRPFRCPHCGANTTKS
jgi:hypothetical protein